MNDNFSSQYPASFCAAGHSGGAYVSCGLCPHNCEIPEGSAGFCGVRKNIGGRLLAGSYGLVSAVALDPIEKKPLYMFSPGARVFSVGGFGCNLNCPFCQNSDISRDFEPQLQRAQLLAPRNILALAEKTVPDGNIGVAYTYNEPLIGYEFLYDCAKLMRKNGLLNVVVTNGYINREPLKALLPLIDAMNIDLKGFTESFYKKLGGSLAPVKEAISLASEYCHVEVTTLIIPSENDSPKEIAELAEWLSDINPEIPLHLTRFFPRREYASKQPTPRETLHDLWRIAKKYLKNVFIGNI